MIFEIADVDSKLKTWVDLVSNCNVLDFSEQIEHANYKYINRN